MKKHAFREYFYYTRRERSASIGLMILIISFLLAPEFFPLLILQEKNTDHSRFVEAIDKLTSPDSSEIVISDQTDFRGEVPQQPVELFAFDPNTVNREALMQLGLTAGVAQTWINYRNKGGRFYKKEDIGKLYGLRKEDYERLLPWVTLRSPEQPERDTGGAKPSPEYKKLYPDDSVVVHANEPAGQLEIDINAATAGEWQQLRGIGPGYSRRIVKFRQKLGGFAGVEQVGETYGLPDSVFRAIKPFLRSSPVFRKLSINSASLEELKVHPYLSNFQATILFNYRTQHGAFGEMEDLMKVKAGFEEEDWIRLEPYLTFE